MQPTRPLWRSQADLMAADTALLAAAASMLVHLAQQPFTPGLDLALTDLTEATFTGSAALDITTGAQIVYYDAVDGELTILLKSPAGGLHWVCTVTPGAPQTIYGVYLTDNANAVLLGALRFDNPIGISAAGQGIDVADLTLKFSAGFPR